MTLYERPILEGWLHKYHHFTIRIFLKHRFFVLLGTKFLYFKQPYDKYPSGTIQLKRFCVVKIQRTGPLYGFRITSQCTNHQSPVLYADSQEERHTWMTTIQNTLDALSSYDKLYDNLSDVNKTQKHKKYQPISKKNKPISFCCLPTSDLITATISTNKSGFIYNSKSLSKCSIYNPMYEIEETQDYPKSSIHVELERDIYVSHINSGSRSSHSDHTYLFFSLPPPPRK